MSPRFRLEGDLGVTGSRVAVETEAGNGSTSRQAGTEGGGRGRGWQLGGLSVLKCFKSEKAAEGLLDTSLRQDFGEKAMGRIVESRGSGRRDGNAERRPSGLGWALGPSVTLGKPAGWDRGGARWPWGGGVNGHAY